MVRNPIFFLALLVLVGVFGGGNQLLAQATPTYVVSIDNSGVTSSVAISGNYAFLANDTNGLWIYEISNKAHPVNISHTSNGAVSLLAAAHDVAISGNHAFVANDADGIRIYNISNPTNPISVGHTLTNYGGRAYGIAVSGNYAYLANYTDGLRIFNVSNPTNPVSVGRIFDGTVSSYAMRVVLSGNHAYVAKGKGGVHVYNVANPANPVGIASDPANVYTVDVAVSGSYACTASYNNMRIYDISNPTNLTLVSQTVTNTTRWAYGVAMVGNLAYLADDLEGLRIYDLSNPANPVNVGVMKNGAAARGITVSGNYAFVPSETSRLDIYSLDLRLTSTRTSTNMTLAWPTSSPTAFLQQNGNLNTANWLNVTNIPSVVSGQKRVILSKPATNNFYRLRLL